MCKRLIIVSFDEAVGIAQRIMVGPRDNPVPEWPARKASAYPGSAAPIIAARFDTGQPAALGPGSLEVREPIWGFEAAWTPGLIFNTRLDGAAKPLWRDALAHRRCLIPCRAFFESSEAETIPSPRTGKPIRRPYELRLPDGAPLLIGGIWQGERFSMVTTEANGAMAPIHHRMPLVVAPEEVPVWLGPDYQHLADRSHVRLDAAPETLPGQQLPLL